MDEIRNVQSKVDALLTERRAAAPVRRETFAAEAIPSQAGPTLVASRLSFSAFNPAHMKQRLP